MRYVRLGTTGTKVSAVCLGMMTYGDPGWREWVLDEDDAEPVVRAAVDAGITFFDTADMYSLGVSEQVTGRLLDQMFARREDYVLATKVFMPLSDGPNAGGLSRTHISNAIDASLRRLGTDYVDLYQIHRWDPETPIEETMDALDGVVRAGKARYIGASSMWAWQLLQALHAAERNGWTRFVTMQNHYNLLYREEEREMMPLCVDQGIGCIPWSPLARGRLARPAGAQTTTRSTTDAVGRSMYAAHDDADREVVDAMQEVASARGIPMAQVALAWLMGRPGVSAPIVGASKSAQLDDAVAAVELELTDDEVAALQAPYVAHPVLGHT